MIRILVNVGFDRTVRNLLETCDNRLDDTLTVETYQDVFTRRRLRPGTYVFTDFERCSAGDTANLLRLWDQLARSGGARLVNDPRRVLWRYPLLRLLADRGVNEFTCYRPTDDLRALRYPVFLRCEHDHGGVRTGLIHTAGELQRAITRMRRNPWFRNQILIVEYRAASDDDGLYRKYGALYVHGHVLPCHVIVSPQWFVKGSTRLVTPEIVKEEAQYIEANAHAAELAQLLALAHIEYGRVDYGFVDGRLQVYEINTNPTIVGGRGGPIKSERRAKRLRLTDQLVEAFREMDAAFATRPDEWVSVNPRAGAVPAWMYGGLRKLRSLSMLYGHRSGMR